MKKKTSDFKTDEYSSLLGGKQFEPTEANPMIGWRGASRYYGTERARESFALECMAVRRVVEQLGMTNLQVMIPFTRTVDELQKVLAEMKRNGLDKSNIKIIMMCEIPVRPYIYIYICVCFLFLIIIVCCCFPI